MSIYLSEFSEKPRKTLSKKGLRARSQVLTKSVQVQILGWVPWAEFQSREDSFLGSISELPRNSARLGLSHPHCPSSPRTPGNWTWHAKL